MASDAHATRHMYVCRMFQGQKTRIFAECLQGKIPVMDMPIVNPYTIFNKLFTNRAR